MSITSNYSIAIIPMIGMGRATTSTPQIAHMEPQRRPRDVSGAISPYPTCIIMRGIGNVAFPIQGVA